MGSVTDHAVAASLAIDLFPVESPPSLPSPVILKETSWNHTSLPAAALCPVLTLRVLVCKDGLHSHPPWPGRAPWRRRPASVGGTKEPMLQAQLSAKTLHWRIRFGVFHSPWGKQLFKIRQRECEWLLSKCLERRSFASALTPRVIRVRPGTFPGGCNL